MEWVIFLLPVLFAVCSAGGGISKDATEASESDQAGATGGITQGIFEYDSLTQETVSSKIISGSSVQTSTSDPGATAEASVTGGVSQKTNPPRVPGVSEDKSDLPVTPTTSITSSTTTAKPTTTTPKPTTTTPKPTKPPSNECDPCKQPDFMGFGFEPGKCGCCPWPCCCKCVQVTGGKAAPCRALLDLSFIMDESGSIGSTDWVVAKQFFKDVVSTLKSIGTDQFVSSITFSTNATLNWNLIDAETASAEALASSIDQLERSGEFTNTVAAMELALNEVFVDGIDNIDAANVVVVMTDGRANFRQGEMEDIAQRLRRKADIICVGVTNRIDRDELRKICREENIFSVVDFQSLNTILNSLQTKICPTPSVSEKCFCCCTPEQFWANGGARFYNRW